MRRIPRIALVALLLASASPTPFASATTAPGGDLPVNLQLGTVLRLPGGGSSVAVPLEAAPADCTLDADGPQLRLEPAPVGGGTWLVLEPVAAGSVSGLLSVRGADGSERTVAVAGEVVDGPAATPPRLLVSARRGDRPLRRYVRMVGLPALAAVALPGGRADVAAPGAAGWQQITIDAPAGRVEAGGSLRWADGTIQPLQIALEEAITVLAQAELPTGWTWQSVRALRENLRSGGLRGRVAVRGIRADARALRFYDVRWDPANRRQQLIRAGGVDLPAVQTGLRARMVPVRLRGLPGPEPAFASPALLRMADARAFVLDARAGIRAGAELPGLRFSGAAAASVLRGNEVYAVRRDLRSGANLLRRWQVRSDGTTTRLRGHLFEGSLEARAGVRSLTPRALVARRTSVGWPDQPLGERLLLLASTTPAGKASLPLTLYSLRFDPKDPSRLAAVRARWESAVGYPPDGTPASLAFAPCTREGSHGFPLRLQVLMPALGRREIVERSIDGGAFGTVARSRTVNLRSRGAALPLLPPRFLRADVGDAGTTIRRRAFVNGEMVLRSRADLPAVQLRDLRASTRSRRSFALGTRKLGDPGAPQTLRLLDNGLAGAAVPPTIRVGSDLKVAATGPGGAVVSLRARAATADGTPPVLRWSARADVSFSDPGAERTDALVPVGTHQIRARAVTSRAKAAGYAAGDVLTVEVVPASAVDDPGLRSALRGVYPNPANPRVRVAFTLARREPVQLRVYDLAGRLVATVLDEVRNAGAWDVEWDGTDARGRAVASGVYHLQLVTPDGNDLGRAVILR